MNDKAITTDIIKQIVSKFDVSAEEAFDIAINFLSNAKKEYPAAIDNSEDWDNGHLYSVWVYCYGTWNTGDTHSWHSRRHDADDLSRAADQAWRDFYAHEANEPDATHWPREFYLHNW